MRRTWRLRLSRPLRSGLASAGVGLLSLLPCLQTATRAQPTETPTDIAAATLSVRGAAVKLDELDSAFPTLHGYGGGSATLEELAGHLRAMRLNLLRFHVDVS